MVNRIVIFLVVSACSLPLCDVCAIDIGTGQASYDQRFEAWGTSLAWMGNELGGSTNSFRRDQMMDLLFDQTNGLGLNFARYNIGAGQNPGGPAITRPGAAMDGWVPAAPSNVSDSSTWAWDWNADATQRWVLDAAVERGVTQVEAFANSAPWWMTIAQSSTGNPAGGANLDTSNYDEFAHYLLEVSAHFRLNEGIQFNSLAPMNEPGAGWWTGGSRQEGMNVPLGSRQSSLIREVGMQIANRNSTLHLVAPEETSTDQTLDAWRFYGSITKSYISQVNTHTYPFNGGSGAADSAALYTAVSQDGKKIYATEFGTGKASEPLAGGINLANQIRSDLRNLKAEGWTYWQAVEDNNGSNWGLLIAPFDGNNNWFNMRQQYYAMQQFSSYIRPGAQILNQTDDETIAAYDPRTDSTTLVITNENGTSSTKNYTLTDKTAEDTRVIRTWQSNNFEALGPATVSNGQLNMSVPGESITTVVIHHKPNLLQNGGFALGSQPIGSSIISGWQASGGGFLNTQDNTMDGSGSGAFFTNFQGNAGSVKQTGIGDADTDLSGVAFEFSLDVRFQNEGNNFYDADTYLAIEFYGADDQTLTHGDTEDFQTRIIPALAIDETKGTDSLYRTYRSERFVAPEGTRYVRPVIRYGGVESGSNAWTYFDNARLQEAHPAADAREWSYEGSGNWSESGKWLNHAKVENNKQMYFGNAIEQASTVTLDSVEDVQGLAFFSPHAYTLQGNGTLNLGAASASDTAVVDVRMGSHLISVAAELTSDIDFRVLDGSTLTVDTEIDLNGKRLKKLGAGAVNLTGGLDMANGSLAAYASSTSNFSLGASPILNGDFELLLAPGQDVQLGDSFELVSYTGLTDTFDTLFLPELDSSLAWDVDYGPSALTVSVINVALPGDFNDNGIVDAADFTLWRDNLGGSEALIGGNGDGNSVVDANDYQLWKDNFGNVATTASTYSTVPEPERPWFWLLLAGIAGFARRRNQGRNLDQNHSF